MSIFSGLGLKVKMLLASCGPLVLVVVLVSLCYASINSLLDSNKWVNHTHEVIAKAKNIEAMAVDMETGMRGYLLAGKDEFLDPYRNGEKKFYSQIKELQKTVSDNPPQVQLLSEISATIKEWQQKVTEPTIELRGEIGHAKTMDDIRDLTRKKQGKIYFDKFRGQIKEFIDREEVLLKKRRDKSKKSNNAKELKEAMNWVEHTYKVIGEANAILGSAVDMETGMRGFLLAGQEEFLEPYKSGSKSFYSQIAQLQKTVSDNPAQVKLLGEIQGTIKAWQENVTTSAIALRRDIGHAKSMNDMAKLVGEARGKKYFDKFREQIGTFTGKEAALMEVRKAEATTIADNTIYIIVFGMTITIICAMILSYVTSGSIVNPILETAKRLSELANQVASVATQSSSSSMELSQAANEQASSIQETSSSLEEMTAMVDNNVSNSEQTSTLSEEVRGSCESANESMKKLIVSMEEILESNEKIQELVKVIGEIGEQTSVIDEIVFQTKLLSFNASVEAERAGEHGRGFAVVAQEVGNLAQMSGNAAGQISRIVNESIKNAQAITSDNQKKVEAGNELVKRSDEILTTIARNSDKMSEGAKQILNASRDQANGIKQINVAMTALDKTTQANAASSEQTASSAEEMNAQAVQLNAQVQALKQLVTGVSESYDMNHVNTSIQLQSNATPANKSFKNKVNMVRSDEGKNNHSPIKRAVGAEDDGQGFGAELEMENSWAKL